MAGTAPTPVFSGTANRALVTDVNGAVAVSAITDSILGYLAGATSNIQAQINTKLPSGTFVDWSVAGAGATLDPTRLNLITANRVVVTNPTSTPIASTVLVSELEHLSGVTSSIQTQLNSKLAKADLLDCALTGKILTSDGISFSCVDDATSAGSIETNLQNGVSLKPYGVAAGETGEFRFYDLAAGGSFYTGFKSPDTLAGNILYVMPSTAPTGGYVLSSDASNNLSWIAIPSAPVPTVFGRNGAIVAVAGDYNAGLITNTPAGDIAAVTVQTAINELDAEKQSIASLAGSVRGVLLDAVSFAETTAITATDSILVAFGKLQGQITNVVGDVIADGVTTKAPSQNAVFDALASKLDVTSYIKWEDASISGPFIDPTRLTLAGADGGKVLISQVATGKIIASANITTTELDYLDGVTSSIQTQLGTKQPNITAASVLTSGSIETNLQAGVSIKPYGTAAGETGEFRFYDLVAGGSFYTGFKSPDTLAGNILYVMPSTAPTVGQVLSSDASNNLSWIAIPSAPVPTVFGRNGAIVAVAGDYNAGLITNTPAGNIAAVTVQAAINELDTEKQSIASFAGDVRGVLLDSVSFVTTTAITAADSILVAFGKLQGQINTLDTSKVAENGSYLYFTDTRALSASVEDAIVDGVAKAPSQNAVFDALAGKLGATGFTIDRALTTNNSGAIVVSGVTTTELDYLGGVTSSIQTQLGTKQPNITAASVLTSGSIETNLQAGVSIKPYGTAAGETGEFRFYDLVAGGSFYTGFKSPDTLAGNILYVMPSTAPTVGQVLSSDASNNLSWTSFPAAPVTTVFGRAGVVVATAGDYNAGLITNTPAGNIAAITAQAAINELDSEKQSIASFAGDVRGVLLDAVSFVTTTAITATDSILVAFGKLQGQITALVGDVIVDGVTTKAPSQNAVFDALALKADLSNGAQQITAGNINTTTINGKSFPDLTTVVTTSAIEIGTLAARPLATAKNAGAIYVVNDLGSETIFVSTGSAWIKMATNVTPIANGGTGSTSFTGDKVVVANPGGTALISGPSIDSADSTDSLVKRGADGRVVAKYVVPTTVVTENVDCSTFPKGTIATDVSGNILTCQ